VIGFVSRKARGFMTPRNASACVDAGTAKPAAAAAGQGAVPASGAPLGKNGAASARDTAAIVAGKGVAISRIAAPTVAAPTVAAPVAAPAAAAAAADKNAAAASSSNGLKSIIAVEPSGRAPGSFIGAALPVCGVDVLVVVVYPWVLADIHEANLYVVAFGERFRRRIVLTAQGPEGTPCFYGPTDIIRVLRGLPFEMLPWRRYLFRIKTPPAWRLPVPAPRGAERADGIDGALGEGSAATPHTAGARRADSIDDTTPHRRARRVDHPPGH
jgi:hypothetical protein